MKSIYILAFIAIIYWLLALFIDIDNFVKYSTILVIPLMIFGLIISIIMLQRQTEQNGQQLKLQTEQNNYNFILKNSEIKNLMTKMDTIEETIKVNNKYNSYIRNSTHIQNQTINNNYIITDKFGEEQINTKFKEDKNE